MDKKFDFGVIGLGVMGQNLLRNIADKGFKALGLDQQADKTEAINATGTPEKLFATQDQSTFLASLASPRKIFLLVPAGKIVDQVIDSLLPHLDKGDLIMDGGNSFFEDTERRVQYVNAKNVQYFGVGVSGGAKGARFGPSMMVGGSEEAYEGVRPIFEAIAAKVKNDPCVDFLGTSSAGHYVKMVHNGIEYGMMQLIAEAYDLLRNVGGMGNEAIEKFFKKGNEGKLNSFLVEITASIFSQKDDLTDTYLIDKILDKAKQKGTGKWTSQSGFDLGIPIPAIDASVTMRAISAMKDLRVKLNIQKSSSIVEPNDAWLEKIENMLYFGFVILYAQGFHLMRQASIDRQYGLNLQKIAKIWRGGCIIRSSMLEKFMEAFSANPQMEHLFEDVYFGNDLKSIESQVRDIMCQGIMHRTPMLVLSNILCYYDAFHSASLPLNLVQAQRDFFGSHTYERTDCEGVFHTEWE